LVDKEARIGIIRRFFEEPVMIIDVDKVPKDGLTVARDFEFSSQDLVEESATFIKPVHADLTVRKMDEEVWIRGRVTTRLNIACSRCLAPFEFPVDARFDLVFLPQEFQELKEALDEGDVDQLFYQDRRIDLREVVLEQLNLTFPAKPLCSESCEGICAICGKIRRDGDCGCAVHETDGRLDALKSMLKDKS
jgi:uncharacterized protein